MQKTPNPCELYNPTKFTLTIPGEEFTIARIPFTYEDAEKSRQGVEPLYFYHYTPTIEISGPLSSDAYVVQARSAQERLLKVIDSVCVHNRGDLRVVREVNNDASNVQKDEKQQSDRHEQKDSHPCVTLLLPRDACELSVRPESPHECYKETLYYSPNDKKAYWRGPKSTAASRSVLSIDWVEAFINTPENEDAVYSLNLAMRNKENDLIGEIVPVLTPLEVVTNETLAEYLLKLWLKEIKDILFKEFLYFVNNGYEISLILSQPVDEGFPVKATIR